MNHLSNSQHAQNGADANRPEFKSAPKIKLGYQARRVRDLEMKQEPNGEWSVKIGSGQPMPATDVEVELYLRWKEAM